MFLRTLALLVVAASPALADDAELPKGVKKVELAVTPADARPGQTVTVKITVTLADGFHTYPTKQGDKNAANYVNTLTFPDTGSLIFVGDISDPAEFKSEAVPEQGIKELKTVSGAVTYERKAVVSPKAAAGDAAVKVTAMKVSICDEKNCYPSKTLTPEGTLKIQAGPAVEVEKAYADAVKAALEKK